MKVLVLHSELGVLRGGGENFSRHLFSAFAKRGHCVTAAFVADRKGRYPLAVPAGIEPIPLRGWWSSNFGQTTLSSATPYLPPEGRFRNFWDRVQGALSWRAFAWHKKRFRLRIAREFAQRWREFDAVYVHGDTFLANAVSQHRPTILRLPGPVTAESAPLLRTVHAVCANGDAFVRVRSFLGDHVIDLPVGLDTQVFTPGPSDVRSRLRWANRHCVLGYVGRLAHLKGVDLLAAAFRDVVRRKPDARLLLVGAGELEPHVRMVLADEFTNGSVHIERDVDHDQLAEWYRAMDIFVLPSRYENHSNALLEAMACGVPFVASDVGGNCKLSATGAGTLFRSESIPSLSESLMYLIDNRGELDAHRHMCIPGVQSPNSWAATAERLEMIIASRLGVKAASGSAASTDSVISSLHSAY